MEGSSNPARFVWIADPTTDGIWYIGSALVGWLYVLLVLMLGSGLQNPVRDPIAVIELGELRVPLTLGLLVFASWALLLDAPHVWSTLARTFLDPDEWRDRRSILLGSLLLFLLGPAAVFGPYLAGIFIDLTPATMALGNHLFFVFFRLWAYYHVVRQHWGFFVLYKRRNQDISDPLENRVDSWFFNASLYLPLALFLTAPWYRTTGMPPLGLDVPVLGDRSIASVLRPLLLVLYPAILLGYVSFQWRRFRQRLPRNGPKLLLLAAIVPLHLIVFVHPLLALFVVPIVTVGHNLQYHRIVWTYGRNKYLAGPNQAYRWAAAAFRSAPVYFLFGLVFTFALYQGPWVEWVKQTLAQRFDQWIFRGVGLVAGIADPLSAGVGARVAAALFLGWAMQHYYLDAKIWRVRRDPGLVRRLGMD